MNDELERIWKEALVAFSRYYPVIYLEGLRKTKQRKRDKPAGVSAVVRS
jgi:hypothetical protein